MTELSLDHVGIAVADLDAGEAQFQRLGFQLTPRGYHTLPPSSLGAARPRTGTGNHCAMLRRGYLEIIGITDPAYQGRLRADLARYEGLHLVAFGTEDAAATASALLGAGFEAAQPRILERPIEERGKTQLARFEIVDFPERLLPEGHFFAIHHGTPDLLWKPGLTTHPNGVTGLEMLTVAVVDPADFARRLGRCLGIEPEAGDGLLFRLAAGKVGVVDGGWIARHLPGKTPALPYIAGIGLATADMGKAADLLKRNGIDHERKSDALIVSPAQACGAFIEFRPSAAQAR
ncbi:MAG TPA: VOC family protein [Dongiaceae bacterium]|nr:VOC family protein [Dongiaceae bacterium]